MNVSRLITLALRLSNITGVGQTPSADDTADALDYLNGMVSQWARKRWLNNNLSDVSFASTGAISYSIGLSQTINVPRPDRLEYAYARLLTAATPLDYPLSIIDSHEDYAAIRLKSLSTFPSAIFYDTSYPNGTIYVWPIPDANWQIHLLVKSGLTQYALLNQDVTLPPEYIDALLYGLGIRLAANYGIEISPDTMRLYRSALNGIRMANAQVTELSVPSLDGGGSTTGTNRAAFIGGY